MVRRLLRPRLRCTGAAVKSGLGRVRALFDVSLADKSAVCEPRDSAVSFTNWVVV